jgi:hypothetical protein
MTPARTALARTRSLSLATVVLLVVTACAGARLTVAVPAITIPADSTAGMVCYAKGEAPGGPRIRSATYRAEATYRRTGGIIDTSPSVDVLVFGRSTAPPSTCVSLGAADVELAGPFTLPVDEPTLVVVGEGAAGEALAALVNAGDYWIGVALDTGFSLGGERTVEFAPGSVTVTF